MAIFEQCKLGLHFAWAGINPGIKSPVNSSTEKISMSMLNVTCAVSRDSHMMKTAPSLDL